MPRTAEPRAGLLRVVARRWRYAVAAVVAVAIAAPVALVKHGTARSRACVASYEAPRGPELPDCRQEVRWFVTPSRVPWTATSARYLAEELTMRQAVAAYADAAVGRPDAEALTRAVDGLFAADKVIGAGSQRTTLEELGRAVGAPDPGRSAMLFGDRRTTVGRADLWPHWSVRLRALEDALLDGDIDRARAIARRYAEFDPRDDDLRLAVAGVLCLSGEGKRALELMTTVQTARARDRHESWARNFGELRATIVACAARSGLPTPPLPERVEAGVADRVDARTALRMRLLTRAHDRDPFLIREVAREVGEMLQKATLPKGERVALLAGLLALGRTLDPNEVAVMATAREEDGEPRLRGAAIDLTAVEWLPQGRGLGVMASPRALVDGAATLRRLAASDEAKPDAKKRLAEAAVAMSLAAARALALGGEPAAAIAELEAAGPDLGDRGRLARSSAWYVAGDAGRALGALEPLTTSAPSEDPRDEGLGVAMRLQGAELCASLGRAGDAAKLAASADDGAATRGDRAVNLRTQWTRLALSRSLRAKQPGAGASLPWVGVMGTPAAWLDAAAEGPGAFADALAFWDAATRAPADQRRAARYLLVDRHAGDVPRARVMQLHLASALLAPGEGDVEVWLDAFGAVSSRGTTMRAYAWARAEAARLRGDGSAAARWTARYAALVKLAAPAEDAEIAAALGI